MKTGELIGVAAIASIVLMFIMGAVGPHSWIVQRWNTGSEGSSIVGGPSLSAAKIDSILSSAGSPAAGTGNVFTLDSAEYNIDDAFAAGVFKHESSYGTSGIASQTHSIGNIRCSDGYACIGGFRSYPSWQAGIDDWFKLISGPLYVGAGLTTPEQILAKYAPSGDGNDPSGYAQDVEQSMAAWRTV